MNVGFRRAGLDRDTDAHAAEIADASTIDLALLGQSFQTRMGRKHDVAGRAFGDALGDGAGGAEFEFHAVAGFLLVTLDQFTHRRLHRARAEHHHLGSHDRCRHDARKDRSKDYLSHVVLPYCCFACFASAMISSSATARLFCFADVSAA